MTVYQKSKRIATVAPRDAYQNALYTIESNGTIRCCLYQDPNSGLGETSGIVRMDVPIAGIEVVPDPNDENKCSVRQILEFNLKGYIPGFVTAQVIKDTAQGLHKIKKQIDPWLASISDDGKYTWAERNEREPAV